MQITFTILQRHTILSPGYVITTHSPITTLTLSTHSAPIIILLGLFTTCPSFPHFLLFKYSFLGKSIFCQFSLKAPLFAESITFRDSPHWPKLPQKFQKSKISLSSKTIVP